jgi:plastocyanin
LDRTPNLPNGWYGASGQLYFNFLHRFTRGSAPARQVSNFPTFTLAAGLPAGALIGFNYATRSDIATEFVYPNEWEFFTRYTFLKQFEGSPLDLSLQAGYNLAAESLDGELTLSRELGPVRLIGVARALSKGYGLDRARYALGGGGTLKLKRWLAFGWDAVTLLDAKETEEVAWGAAVQIAIPYTPHTLSLQASNTNTATLQGASRGGETRRYGFEFTIPINPSRWFGSQPAPVAAPDEPAADTAAVLPVRDTEPRRMPVIHDTAITARPDTSRPTPPPTPTRPDSARPAAQPPAPAPTPAPRREEPARRDPPPRQEAPAQARTVNARMRNLKFEPATIRITPGSTVVWRNDDQVAHTVKAANGAWESPLMQPGGTYRRTFNQAGRFEITCGPHPFMKAVVEVK